MADDLNRKLQARLEDIEKRLQRQERTNPLEAASVTSGRVRFAGGLLRVDSGGSVEIVGTLSIDGTTTVTGTFTVTGPWGLEGDGTISGDVTGTGTLTWNGPWNLNGLGTIAGDTSLTGDMAVKPGGRIVVEGSTPITLEQSGGTASILMGGSEIRGGDGGVGIYPATGAAIITSAAGVRIFSLPTVASASVGGAYPGTLWVNALGFVHRVIA